MLPNLVCMFILPSFRHLLIMGDLDLHLQGPLALKHSKSGHFGLVRIISKKVLHGISPNLHRKCILPSFQHLLHMGDIDLNLQGQLDQKYLKFMKSFIHLWPSNFVQIELMWGCLT